MNTLSITAIEEGTGKTAITLALGLVAQDRNMSVGYMKPKGTRLQSHVGKIVDRDPMLAAELLDLDDSLSDLEPIVYSPTFIENAVREQTVSSELQQRVQTVFTDLSTDRDLMLVEGAGRLTTGGIIELTDAEIAELFDSNVLLVCEFQQLGDLDEILAAVGDIGDRLSGIVFNRVRDIELDRLEDHAIPFLEARGCPVLGVLPHQRDLAGVTVEELTDEIGATQLTTGDSDAFVERFLIGAMGGDEALRYFRRTKNAAVITGGDRSEIHAAAIEAPGVTCLIVTGGHRPASTVLGKAEQAGLPVLAVTADTLSTVERGEEVVRGGRTQDPKTVYKMRELLESHAEIDEILGA